MNKSGPVFFSKSGLSVLASVYVLICIVLWSCQEKLIYSPIDDSVGNWKFCKEHEWASEVSFESEDGTKLMGYYLEKENASSSVLLFHGAHENIGTVTNEACVLRNELNANVFVFDYRGFGKSEGLPDEQGLIEDGHAAMEKLNELSGTVPGDVVVIGRSLGGGPASKTAIDLGAKALVLHSTYAALDDLCASKMPYLPVRLLLRTRFRTSDWIAEFKNPILLAHGTADKLIPIDNSEILFAKSESQVKRFYRQESLGHYNALNSEYIAEVKRFISDLECAEERTGS